MQIAIGNILFRLSPLIRAVDGISGLTVAQAQGTQPFEGLWRMRIEVEFPFATKLAQFGLEVLPDAPVGPAAGSPAYTLALQDHFGNGSVLQFNVDSTPPAFSTFTLSVDPALAVTAHVTAFDLGSGLSSIRLVPAVMASRDRLKNLRSPILRKPPLRSQLGMLNWS